MLYKHHRPGSEALEGVTDVRSGRDGVFPSEKYIPSFCPQCPAGYTLDYEFLIKSGGSENTFCGLSLQELCAIQHRLPALGNRPCAR